jgi:hypothetical protein
MSVYGARIAELEQKREAIEKQLNELYDAQATETELRKIVQNTTNAEKAVLILILQDILRSKGKSDE